VPPVEHRINGKRDKLMPGALFYAIGGIAGAGIGGFIGYLSKCSPGGST